MAIEISTPEQFMAIKDWADRGTADAPLDIIITQDLDFTGITFNGLGDEAYYATLDGQGHTIKNIEVNITGSFYLFGVLRGTAKNINIDNCNISASVLYIFYSTGTFNINNVKINNTNNFTFSNLLYVIRPVAWATEGETTDCIIGGIYTYTGLGAGLFYLVHNKTLKNVGIIATILSAVPIAFSPFYGSNGRYNNTAFNCYSRCNVNATISSGSGAGFGDVKYAHYCYAANTYKDGSITYGFANPSSTVSNSCFYDNTLCPYQVLDIQYGQPTENIKSREWLCSQGWAAQEDNTSQAAYLRDGSTVSSSATMSLNAYNTIHISQISVDVNLSSTVGQKYATLTLSLNGQTYRTRADYDADGIGTRTLVLDVDADFIENTQAQLVISGRNIEIMYDWAYWGSTAYSIYGQIIVSGPVYGAVLDIEFDPVWKIDLNNAGYPWTWGFTEIVAEQNIFFKTENGLIPLTAYYKTDSGLIPLTVKIKE